MGSCYSGIRVKLKVELVAATLAVFDCCVVEDNIDVAVRWLFVVQSFDSLPKVGRAFSI